MWLGREAVILFFFGLFEEVFRFDNTRTHIRAHSRGSNDFNRFLVAIKSLYFSGFFCSIKKAVCCVRSTYSGTFGRLFFHRRHNDGLFQLQLCLHQFDAGRPALHLAWALLCIQIVVQIHIVSAVLRAMTMVDLTCQEFVPKWSLLEKVLFPCVLGKVVCRRTCWYRMSDK